MRRFKFFFNIFLCISNLYADEVSRISVFYFCFNIFCYIYNLYADELSRADGVVEYEFEKDIIVDII